MTDLQLLILAELKMESPLTSLELSEILEVSSRTVIPQLTGLKKIDYVENHEGKWEITDKGVNHVEVPEHKPTLSDLAKKTLTPKKAPALLPILVTVTQDYLDDLDKLVVLKLENKEEKLKVLNRLKSIFTTCEMNEKLHDVIDSIIKDYK